MVDFKKASKRKTGKDAEKPVKSPTYRIPKGGPLEDHLRRIDRSPGKQPDKSILGKVKSKWNKAKVMADVKRNDQKQFKTGHPRRKIM